MKINNLRLKGFEGIRRGLGLEEININFSDVTGLVALAGQNGLGKSTVLENLQPYNMLVSRDGALFNHCFRRDSEKELSFTYNGHEYRTLLKIDCQSGKSEGFIWRDLPELERQVPYGSIKSTDCSEVNGKITEYAKYIKELFGSSNLFLNSVFCGQNADKLSDMTTGELKTLFAEFLRLDRLQEFEATCKECINVLTGKTSQVETSLEVLKKRTEGAQETREEIERLTASFTDLNANKTILSEKLTAAQKEREGLKEIIARNEVFRAQVDQMKKILDDMNMNRVNEETLSESVLGSLRTKYQELVQEINNATLIIDGEAEIMAAAEKEKELSAKIDGMAGALDWLNEEITVTQGNIHDLELDKSVLTSLLSGLGNDEILKNLDNAIAQRNSAIGIKETAIRDLDNNEVVRVLSDFITEKKVIITDKEIAIKDIGNDRVLIDMGNQIDNFKEKIKGLGCTDPRCPSDCNTCEYITGALAARKALPEAEKKLQERADVLEKSKASLRIEIAKFKEEITRAETEKNSRLAIIEKEKAIIQEAIEELRREIKTANNDKASRNSVIDQDKSRLLNEIQEKESEIKAAKSALKGKMDLRDAKRQELARARLELTKYKDLAARQSEIAVAKSRKADREKALEENKKQGLTASAEWTARAAMLDDQIQRQTKKINEITACCDENAPATLNNLETNIMFIGKAINDTEADISVTSKTIAAKQAVISGIKDAEEQLKKTDAEKQKIMADVSEWTYLRNACGKNGIQALEIDGAAPLITGYANNLLSQAFGSLYTVKFRTQDDEGKECLDIVTISEDGEEVLLDNLSGGQKVWCLMALRLAMTLLSKEKSGRNFQTAFFDEMDGALDPDNAVNFVNLYKSFMGIGHFDTIPFISHKPECRSMADHVLMFEAGKNPYWN